MTLLCSLMSSIFRNTGFLANAMPLPTRCQIGGGPQASDLAGALSFKNRGRNPTDPGSFEPGWHS